MTIRIIDEPDLFVSREDFNMYQQEYEKAYMFYAGPVPNLEQYIRQRCQSRIPKSDWTKP